MTKIIGHRGARGLALENSMQAIKAGLSYALDAIEIDVKRTHDGQLVLMHDADTGRVAGRKLSVQHTDLQGLRAVKLNNNELVPTLEDVFKLVGGRVPLMLDIKSSDCVDELLRLLQKYPKVQVFASGRQERDLKRLRSIRPEIKALIQHHFDPIEVIHRAKSANATGICLNMWLMNPITYRLAVEHGLEVYVYTINHHWILGFFQYFYPKAAVITDHPERFVARRSAVTKD